MVAIQSGRVPAPGTCPRQEVDPSDAGRCGSQSESDLRECADDGSVQGGHWCVERIYFKLFEIIIYLILHRLCDGERPPEAVRTVFASWQGNEVGVVWTDGKRLALLQHEGAMHYRGGLG